MAIILVGIVLLGCSVLPLPTAQTCPAALLSGRLAASGEALVVETEFGDQLVQWPEGYVVEAGPALRLRDDGGNVVASEGDMIFIGGGMDAADEVFIACGHVSTDPP